MSDNQVFHLGGAPTGPDVEAVLKHYPVETLKPGKVIEYVSASFVIGVSPSSSRLKTVLKALRKKLVRDHNIETEAVPGIGFVVIDNAQRVEKSTKKLKSGFKRVYQAGDLASRTPESGLTEEQKKTRTFSMTLAGTVRTIAQTERKKLRYELSVKS